MTNRPMLTLTMFAWLAAVAAAAAGEASPAKARGLLLGGRYAEAADEYRALAENDPAARIGWARCLEAEGRRGEAARLLAERAEGRADLHVELARLRFDAGDHDAAARHAAEALRLDANSLPGRWITAELARASGRLDEADRGYRWLVRHYNAHEVRSAEDLRWIGLAAAQSARWNRLSDQFHFLVNELYPDARKLEPSFWPAHYEAGRLFLEKYNRRDASAQLRAALELNPKAAEVHAALGRLALEERDIPRAKASIDRALEINPELLEGWLLRADLAWANFQVEESLELLADKALLLCPRSEATLGRMAACHLLLDAAPREPSGGQSAVETKPAAGRFEELVAQVAARNPRPGEFYFTLASQLESRNKQREAETYFLRAIEAMPQLLGPRAELGMLHMRAGREDDARRLLAEAFRADPFHVRVKNMLDVLDVLDGFESVAVGGVVLRYDKKSDPFWARYAAAHVAEVYPRLCREFGYEPPDAALVEVFGPARGIGAQQWFAARMTGLPYLGTVAASTGRIVAMVSPAQAGAQFNWARVLTHELVHVVTLQQTDFNIPHWFTEGLAVRYEGCPRPQEWNELLLRRVPAGELFDLGTINFGFTRPGDSDEWHLAYCQAELYVEYMLRLGDDESLRKLLGAYAEGLTTPAAIRRVFGVSIEEFESGYVEYLGEVVGSMSRLRRPSEAPIRDLLEAARERPDDAAAAAELALGYLRRGADREAEAEAERARKLDAKHPLAAYVLARLAVKREKPDEAVALLEAALDPESPEPGALNLLAALKLKAEQYDEAVRWYALGERLDAVDLAWTRSLARVHLQSGNRTALRESLERLARADSDDLVVRKKLAEMALADRRHEAAADWAREAIHITVGDAEVHRMLAEALVGLGRFAEAVEEYSVAVEQRPDDPQARFALADACLQAGQREKAREALDELRRLAPDYPGAELLRESLPEDPNPER